MLSHLTGPARDAFEAILADPSNTLLATDFDGTISPIIHDPEQAHVHPDAVAGLERLAQAGLTVAIITGRPVATVLRLGGFADRPDLRGLTILGQYGAERWDAATGEITTPEVPAAMAELAARLPGVLAEAGWPDLYVEDKGIALVVHTRQATDPQQAHDAVAGPLAELAAALGLHATPGRLVFEIRGIDVDKGGALRDLVAETGARQVVFCGDDLGDIPAFEAVQELRTQGTPGLLVAATSDEQDALEKLGDVAVAGVDGVAALFHWLAHEIDLSSRT